MYTCVFAVSPVDFMNIYAESPGAIVVSRSEHVCVVAFNPGRLYIINFMEVLDSLCQVNVIM